MQHSLPGKAEATLREILPRLVLSPSLFLILLFVYGFILYTGYLSLTDVSMAGLPALWPTLCTKPLSDDRASSKKAMAHSL